MIKKIIYFLLCVFLGILYILYFYDDYPYTTSICILLKLFFDFIFIFRSKVNFFNKVLYIFFTLLSLIIPFLLFGIIEGISSL